MKCNIHLNEISLECSPGNITLNHNWAEDMAKKAASYEFKIPNMKLTSEYFNEKTPIKHYSTLEFDLLEVTREIDFKKFANDLCLYTDIKLERTNYWLMFTTGNDIDDYIDFFYKQN